MALVYLLPLSSLFTFTVIAIYLLKKAKGLNKTYLALFLFMLSTTLAISLVELIIIKHFGYSTAKLLYVLIALIINESCLLVKAYILCNALVNDVIDYATISRRFTLIDPLSIVGLIVILLKFKV